MSKPKKISHNKAKLWAILLMVLAGFILPSLWLGRMIPVLPNWLVWLIALFPLISLAVTLCVGGEGSIKSKITKIRYNKQCPLFFYYRSPPRFNDIQILKDTLQPGDILLRRHDNYVDGLVLSQTSFFTHAGIFAGNTDGKRFAIAHAEGTNGVCFDSLEDFAICDDIAVLRFAFPIAIPKAGPRFPVNISYLDEIKWRLPDNIIMEPRGSGSVWHNADVDIRDVKTFIDGDIKQRENCEIHDCGKRQLKVYNGLLACLNAGQSVVISPDEKSEWIKLVMRQAKYLHGRKYDYFFNFVDFKRLSCIEFVWYCYKFLFPLHQVSRKPMLYFKWLRTFVITPDMLLKSPFFDVKYCSLQWNNRICDLRKFIRKNRLDFCAFISRIIGWQILFFMVATLLYWLYHQFIQA